MYPVFASDTASEPQPVFKEHIFTYLLSTYVDRRGCIVCALVPAQARRHTAGLLRCAVNVSACQSCLLMCSVLCVTTAVAGLPDRQLEGRRSTKAASSVWDTLLLLSGAAIESKSSSLARPSCTCSFMLQPQWRLQHSCLRCAAGSPSCHTDSSAAAIQSEKHLGKVSSRESVIYPMCLTHSICTGHRTHRKHTACTHGKHTSWTHGN